MEQKTLTLTEVAKYIGVSRRTLYNWILTGYFDVESIKGSDPKRWNVENVDEWRFGNKNNNNN